MPCIFRGGVVICFNRTTRLRTGNGGYIYVIAGMYTMPEVFNDKEGRRPIEDWYDSGEISEAVSWFVERGRTG